MNTQYDDVNVELEVDNFKKEIDDKFHQIMKIMSKGGLDEITGDDSFLMFEMSDVIKNLPVRKVEEGKQLGPILMILNKIDGKMHLHVLYINSFKLTDDNGRDITPESNPDLDVLSLINDFILRVFHENIHDYTSAVAVSIGVEFMAGKVDRRNVPDWVKTDEDFDKYTRENTNIAQGVLGSFQCRNRMKGRPKVINLMYTPVYNDGGSKAIFMPNKTASTAITLSDMVDDGVVGSTKVRTYAGRTFEDAKKQPTNKVFTDIFKQAANLSGAEVSNKRVDTDADQAIKDIRKSIEQRKN